MKGARPSSAEIDLAAIAANLEEVRRRAPGCAVIGVVKADAYGHGAVPVAQRLVAGGCERLAVMTPAEAAELREAGLRVPILVLGGVHDAAEAADVVAIDAEPVIQHPGQLSLLAAAARERGVRLPVQVEVDTAMRRMGIPDAEAPDLIDRIAKTGELALTGVYTHLARADEEELAPTREQLQRFARVLDALARAQIDPGRVHVANSAGVLAGAALADDLPARVDTVRPGLVLYGVRPAPHLPGTLRPAMTLRTRVANLRKIAPGDTVGYGGTWRAARPGRVATLPIGYADGVPWSAGNRGHVLLRGRLVPIAGRVSMDLISIDCGDGPVEVGDEVILFGGPPGARLPVEQAAAAAETISYELLVRVGRRVPRVVSG